MVVPEFLWLICAYLVLDEKQSLRKKSEIETSTVTGILRLFEFKALQNIWVFHKVNFVMIQECKMLPT